jgi:hypothetical protein
MGKENKLPEVDPDLKVLMSHIVFGPPRPQTPPFGKAFRNLEELDIPEAEREKALSAITQLEALVSEEQPDKDKVKRCLATLDEVAPVILEALVSDIKNSEVTISSGMRATIQGWLGTHRSK